MSNPDSWTAPILTALKCTHALLFADFECTEWGQAAGQRQVMPQWPLWALLIRKIRLQMAQSQQTSLSATVAGFTLTIYALRE